MSDTATVRPSVGFQYYRNTIYWNRFPLVVKHINKLVSNDESVPWPKYVSERFGGGSRALIPNCGNGHVEQSLFTHGGITSAYGIDLSEASIETARASATATGMPFEYLVADINHVDLSGLKFDRVVNNAAFHHIAYLDRFVRKALEAIDEDGLLLSWDYVGPDRNQYPWRIWSRMVEFNATLPQRYQAHLKYPHLKTMLATDPTEAVHSALIMTVVERYFDIVEISRVGGALAYQILFENEALFQAQGTQGGRDVVRAILDADLAHTREHPEDCLFAFVVARPRKAVLADAAQLETWRLEEETRETAAAENGGRYHPPTALEIITNEISDLRDEVARLD
jgi:SAM-dependent methyltransferase